MTGLEAHGGERVLLQVLADARKIQHRSHTGPAQVVTASDTGEHEEVGGGIGAAAQNGFLPDGNPLWDVVPDIFDVGDPPSIQDKPGDPGRGDDRQVGATAGGIQKSLGGARPFAVRGCQIGEADAFRLLPLEIVGDG